MIETNPFDVIPPGGLLYFNYGLAFIILGVVIISKNMKGSRLRIAVPLKYLALFGFTHGTLEWSELFLLFQGPLMSPSQHLMVKTIGLGFGVTSYLFLVAFSFSLMRRISEEKYQRLILITPLVILCIWTANMIHQWYILQGEPLNYIHEADRISRRYLAFSGSSLTALALFFYSFKVRQKSETTAMNFLWVAGAFAAYSILGGLLPSNLLIPGLRIPVEFFRLLAAVIMTIFIVKGLNIFDLETRRMVSEQTKKLVQAEKLASLGRLAAGVAHEINNPLTNASLNVQMATGIIRENEENNTALLKKVEAIGRNIDRASIIARELLQFSRNDLEVFSQVDVNAVIQEALDTLDFALDSVEVDKQLGSVPKIIGSPGKLLQVIINLLHNSIEAMENGGRVKITTEGTEKNVVITVADSGVGIPGEVLEDLFDPFFTTRETGKGTGLGLFICYGIIQQHRGTINIQSQIGEGTVVTIELPIRMEKYEEDTHSG